MRYRDFPTSDESIEENTGFLRWFEAFDAYFVDRPIKRKAEVVTAEELAKRINDGTYNYDATYDMNDRSFSGDGTLLLVEGEYAKQIEALPPVPAGMFRLVHHDTLGIGISPYVPQTDDYVDLHSHTQELQADIDTFMKSEAVYRRLGFLHRRGLLFYGPPGGGKSRLLERICANYSTEARIILVPPGYNVYTLKSLKAHLQDRITFFLFEELTSTLTGASDMAAFLSFMDGEESWDKCLVLATTNYPEMLPGNIVDRPSRFDRLYRLGNPSAETRRLYLEAKLGKEKVTEELIAQTKGYSIAYLKEMVRGVEVDQKTPLQVLKEFEERKRQVKKEFAESDKSLGFLTDPKSSDD